MTEEEQLLLKQLEIDCQAIKNIEVPEQWKKPDNGPMLTLLAIKDFGPAVVPTLAKLILTNIDLLRENNEVHREHMKSESRMLFFTKVLLILTAVLAFIAIPPAIESLSNLRVFESKQNTTQISENTNSSKMEQGYKPTSHANERVIKK